MDKKTYKKKKTTTVFFLSILHMQHE